MTVVTWQEVDQHLHSLRDLAWRALEDQEDVDSLKKQFSELVQEGYPSEFQLAFAYHVLISYLLGLPPPLLQPLQMPNGSTGLETLGMTGGGQVPELISIAELGSLWMILGYCLKNDTLIYAGLKTATWQAYSLDHQGSPHLSLWVRAASFNQNRLAAHNHLLFTLAYRLTSENGFLQAAQLQKTVYDPHALTTKLQMLIPEKLEAPIRLTFRPLAEEITVGLLKFATPQMSIACALSGWNSGLMSYHKNHVAIVNCGPQVTPLDDLSSFGIDRSCSLNRRRFQEVVWDKSVYNFRLKGWTKAFALPLWLEVDFAFQAHKLSFSCFIQEERPRDNLNFVFYCKCQKVVIGGRTSLQAGDLNRYQGKALPLELCSNDENIFLEPSSDQEMEIVPLAGGEFFWGANFLVAFRPLKNLLHYSVK